MKRPLLFCLISVLYLSSCGPKPVESSPDKFVIAFGSCNKHNVENVFWDDILAHGPDVFIWGGDIIYADTDNIDQMSNMYAAQNAVSGYNTLKKKVPVIGTWDDHDYGLNDGGVEFSAKKESQQAFLDFMAVSENDPRRTREGVYTSHMFEGDGGSVKIIVLDTRYFRSRLSPSAEKGKRYEPNLDEESTILGSEQWGWLKEELFNSKADFNLIVTSIQLVSGEHGFEKWANFPHEVERMKNLVVESKAKGVVVLSGDRHISEFSRAKVEGLPFPLIDFTSSGLTHSYSSFTSEPNKNRVGAVISETSFGLVELNLQTKEAVFKIMGENGQIYQQLKQIY